MRGRGLATLLIAGALLLAGLHTWGSGGLVPQPHLISAQGPTATPTPRPWHRQITLAGEAIELVLRKWWPEDANIAGYTAHMVSMATLEQFLNSTDLPSSPNTPVWIVGVLTPDPLPDDYMPGPGVQRLPSGSKAAGAFYAITANDGQLLSAGVLYDASTPAEARPKYSALAALADESIPVVTPSLQPTYGVSPEYTPDT